MQSQFRKISRIGTLSGGTKWYLSEDCLLAAKRVMYSVEYRRFYLRDLESIVVWRNKLWLLRPITLGVLFAALGNLFWWAVNVQSGAIFWGTGLAWVALEVALGPTAQTRIRTTGLTVDLSIVKRARRAREVLAKIDAAVRASRPGTAAQVAAPAGDTQQTQPSPQMISEPSPATAPVVDLT